MAIYFGQSRQKLNFGGDVCKMLFAPIGPAKPQMRKELIYDDTLMFVRGDVTEEIQLDHLCFYVNESTPFNINPGKRYLVFWDDVEYISNSFIENNDIGIGNLYILSNNDSHNTNEPFVLGIEDSTSSFFIMGFSNKISDTEVHSVSVYEIEQEITGFSYNSTYGAFAFGTTVLFSFEADKTYSVIWDGVEYTCQAQNLPALNAIAIGDLSTYGGSGNNEPFAITFTEGVGNMFFSKDDKSTHTIFITEKK